MSRSDWYERNVDKPWCQVNAEGCQGRATDTHHRKMRSQGGDNEPQNLLRCCHHCHMAVHASPAWAYSRGFLVKSWQDPALVEVVAA